MAMTKKVTSGSSTSSRNTRASKSSRSNKKTTSIIKKSNLTQKLEKELAQANAGEMTRDVYDIFQDIYKLEEQQISIKLKEQIIKYIISGPEENDGWWEITEQIGDSEYYYEKELVEPYLDDIKKIIDNEQNWTDSYELPNSLITLLQLTNNFELNHKKVGEIYITALDILYASGESASALDVVRNSLIEQISKLSK